jgi:hypothetical protein
MSEDIVKRLRDIHVLATALGGNCDHLIEAADEIERLREERDGWEKRADEAEEKSRNACDSSGTGRGKA